MGFDYYPTPRRPRYVSLDLWRGVACLFVVLYHAGGPHVLSSTITESGPSAWLARIVQQLWVGVPMFFVISGYCIAATVDASRRRPHPLRGYFFRRFRRIYPPAWILMAVLGILFMIPGQPMLHVSVQARMPYYPPWWYSPWQWLGNLTLTELWRYHLGGPPSALFIGVLWTLCYEEQFYAVMGLLLWVARRHLFTGAAVVTVLTLGMGLLSRRYGIAIDGFFFDGFWLLFAAGILVYYRINYATDKMAWALHGLLVVALLASVFGPFALTLHPAAGFAFALLLSLLHRWDGSLASSRRLRPLFFCGTICYSMYLTHQPVVLTVGVLLRRAGIEGLSTVLFVTLPACVAASVSIASAFYGLVERRFLNGGPRGCPTPS